MGPQSPSKRVLDGIAMGIWMGVSRRCRSPNSALECADARGPPEEQRVILGRLGRFIFRNLVHSFSISVASFTMQGCIATKVGRPTSVAHDGDRPQWLGVAIENQLRVPR